MINVSGFVALVSGINHHIPIDFTQVEVCFSTMLHFPKPLFTCFVINNCSGKHISLLNEVQNAQNINYSSKYNQKVK